MGPLDRHYDVVVIGAGIAGASIAYFLAERGMSNVLVVERENQPAYHATGRSAASLVEIDLNPTVEEIKIIGASFLRDPTPGFAAHALLEQRGVLVLLDAARWAHYGERAAELRARGMRVDLVGAESASALVDGQLDAKRFHGAAHLTHDGFVDVHELLGAYMANARRAGVSFVFGREVVPETAGGRVVEVRIDDVIVQASTVVNAAGAWAQEVGRMAGATTVTLTPKRRCMAVLDVADDLDLRSWPMVWCDDLRVYFRDDAGRLMLCPMDELAMEPCDASWDEYEIAAGIERLCELAPGLRPRAVRHRWAGLRTFADDGVPVVGRDPVRPEFFWLAGQGGCGIETSGALGAIAADLLVHGRTERFDARRISPDRFVV